MVDIESSFIEIRAYQELVLQKLADHNENEMNSIVELDCGLGKRVLQYILTKKYPTESFIIILNSSASLGDTLTYFQKLGISDLGYYRSGMNSRFRLSVLKKNRILLTTPQSLANTLQKESMKIHKDIIIINEIDSIVRRVANRRVLIHPYNYLIPYFSNSWFIGLSGTLRDSHVIISEDSAKTKPDLLTLTEELPDIRLITMDSLFKSPDLQKYIQKSHLSAIPVKDSFMEEILNEITEKIKERQKQILDQVRDEDPQLLKNTPSEEWGKLIPHLPAEHQWKQDYSNLTLIRKYLTGMQPEKARRYLNSPRIAEVLGHYWKKLPKISPKIDILPDLIKNTPKSVILCSYLDTADAISEELKRKMGISVLIVSGQVKNKREIVHNFRNLNDPVILVLTNVGERDLDLPEADLLIIYDTINTVKTMYQKMKRTRGGEVKVLYHANTFEQAKVNRLFKKISENYPWSVNIDFQSSPNNLS